MKPVLIHPAFFIGALVLLIFGMILAAATMARRPNADTGAIDQQRAADVDLIAALQRQVAAQNDAMTSQDELIASLRRYIGLLENLRDSLNHLADARAKHIQTLEQTVELLKQRGAR